MVYQRWYKTKDGCPLLIRNAVSDDAYAVTELDNQILLDSPFLSRGPGDEEDDVEGTLSYIVDLLSAPREAFLVALIDGKIIGSAHLDGCGSRKKMLHRCEIALGVQKNYRNKGVGHCLMDALLYLARDAGYEQVELNVIEDNVLGVSLYKSFGFQTTGKIPHAYKYSDSSYGDYLVMILYFQNTVSSDTMI